MAKARIGLYSVKGDTLTRTHKPCPKCGPGTFLAEHANRRSCGHCGYSETKTVVPGAAPTKPVVASKGGAGAKSPKPAPPAAAPKPAAPAAAPKPAPGAKAPKPA